MKLALVLAVLTAAICARPLPAHAVAACNNNDGFSPRAGTELPPHARLLAWGDRSEDGTYVARIDGKVVPIKITKRSSTPYTMQLIEIDSDKTGTLTILFAPPWTQTAEEIAKYTVRSGAKMPKDVQGATSRFERKLRHSTVREEFEALAISIGDTTPAILAHVKIRRDDQAPWQELDAPVIPGDWMDKHTMIRIGALGCSENYGVSLLKAGVDINVSVTLVDGTTRTVALPAHLKLPN
jgi:hypothetical protein